MDVYPKEIRSSVMRSVKSQNTKPELRLRRLLYRAGYRYRLYRKDLPGNPDITFPSRRKVIFVHGCFWHQHPNCPHAARPVSNVNYWDTKLNRNMGRDARNLDALRELGWNCLTVWECQMKDTDKLLEHVKRFLDA